MTFREIMCNQTIIGYDEEWVVLYVAKQMRFDWKQVNIHQTAHVAMFSLYSRRRDGFLNRFTFHSFEQVEVFR